MAYTDDAMISVLQKAYEAVRHKETTGEFAPPIQCDDFNEECCLNIAAYMGYFTVNERHSVMSILPIGLFELNRLLESKEQKRREERLVAANDRSTKVAFGTSVFSVVILAITLVVTVFNSFSTTVLKQPVQIEILSPPVSTLFQQPDTKTEPFDSEIEHTNPCCCKKTQ